MKDFCNVGHLLRDHRVDAGVLEAHGVQHPGGGLRDPGLRVARTALCGSALPGEAAQKVQVVQLCVLPAIAEGAGGGDYGIFQLHPCKADRQAYHTISSLYRMGPSLHTRL